jgi:hypothetical protein
MLLGGLIVSGLLKSISSQVFLVVRSMEVPTLAQTMKNLLPLPLQPPNGMLIMVHYGGCSSIIATFYPHSTHSESAKERKLDPKICNERFLKMISHYLLLMLSDIQFHPIFHPKISQPYCQRNECSTLPGIQLINQLWPYYPDFHNPLCFIIKLHMSCFLTLRLQNITAVLANVPVLSLASYVVSKYFLILDYQQDVPIDFKQWQLQ